MGREGIVHKSAIDIMDLFEKQLQGATASSSSGKVEVSKPAEMSMVSLGQSYDPTTRTTEDGAEDGEHLPAQGPALEACEPGQG